MCGAVLGQFWVNVWGCYGAVVGRYGAQCVNVWVNVWVNACGSSGAVLGECVGRYGALWGAVGQRVGLCPQVLLRNAAPLALVYFFEYFINQGLVSDLWGREMWGW